MVDDGRLDHPNWTEMVLHAMRRHAPLLVALALVGTGLGGLLVGYEPVGGDPDRLYRPLKSELARAMAEGRLPFWSSKFGLGVPLIAESHVAAFYPPNLVLYRAFDVPTAYRLSMWLHYVALVATTYLYARCLGLSTWGSALAGVSFALCGFQTIHSSHEPFYSMMPYLPLALYFAERYHDERAHDLACTPGTLSGSSMDTGPFSDPDVDRSAGDLDRLCGGRDSKAGAGFAHSA